MPNSDQKIKQPLLLSLPITFSLALVSISITLMVNKLMLLSSGSIDQFFLLALVLAQLLLIAPTVYLSLKNLHLSLIKYLLKTAFFSLATSLILLCLYVLFGFAMDLFYCGFNVCPTTGVPITMGIVLMIASALYFYYYLLALLPFLLLAKGIFTLYFQNRSKKR